MNKALYLFNRSVYNLGVEIIFWMCLNLLDKIPWNFCNPFFLFLELKENCHLNKTGHWSLQSSWFSDEKYVSKQNNHIMCTQQFVKVNPNVGGKDSQIPFSLRNSSLDLIFSSSFDYESRLRIKFEIFVNIKRCS